MKKIVSFILSATLLLSSLSITAFANSETKSIRDSDGTLILAEYPEMAGSTEKDAAAEAYINYRNGCGTLTEVMQAYKTFFLSVGDYQAAMSICNNEAAFSEKYIGSSAISRASYGYVTSMNHYTQEKQHYCGPATAQSILDTYGDTASQTTLANNSNLQTEIYNGTPWYTDSVTQYVMANVLNNRSTAAFVAKSNPTTSELKSRVMTAVDSFGHGVAANFNIPTGASRPTGYGSGIIQHWVPIRGYLNNGDSIAWFEPVYGATTVSWYSNVTTRYYYDTAANVASYVNSRGIIW